MSLSGWESEFRDKVVTFLAPLGICLRNWNYLLLDFTRTWKAGRDYHGGAIAKLVGDQRVQEMSCGSHHSEALEFCSWPYRLNSPQEGD